MAKTVYRLEVVREFDSKDDAVRAAEQLERAGDRKVTVYMEHHTDSGQAYTRRAVWKDIKQEREEREQMIARESAERSYRS
jgi:hypothetical protein